MALLAGLLLAGCNPAPPTSEVGSGARKVVTFRGGEVTEGEVVEGVERLSAQSAASTGQPAPEVQPGSPEFEAAKTQVVPALLAYDVARAYARENGIRVPEQEVQAEVDAAKEQVAQQAEASGQNLGPDEAFRQALEQFGFTEESFREEVRTGLLVQKVQEEVVGDAGPSEEEVRRYYDENKELEFTTPETRCIRHILFAGGAAPGEETTESSEEAEASKEEARQNAEDVKRQLEDGGDFAELARESSDDPGSAEQGGDLGCNPSGGFVPEFDEAAFSAEEGELVGPVETEFGYHLIEVTEIREPGETPFEEARPQIEEQLSTQQQEVEFQAWIQDQLEKRDVKYLPGYDPNAPPETPPEAPSGEAPPPEGEGQ